MAEPPDPLKPLSANSDVVSTTSEEQLGNTSTYEGLWLPCSFSPAEPPLYLVAKLCSGGITEGRLGRDFHGLKAH